MFLQECVSQTVFLEGCLENLGALPWVTIGLGILPGVMRSVGSSSHGNPQVNHAFLGTLYIPILYTCTSSIGQNISTKWLSICNWLPFEAAITMMNGSTFEECSLDTFRLQND